MSSDTLIVIEIDGKLLNALEITAWSLQLDQRLPWEIVPLKFALIQERTLHHSLTIASKVNVLPRSHRLSETCELNEGRSKTFWEIVVPAIINLIKSLRKFELRGLLLFPRIVIVVMNLLLQPLLLILELLLRSLVLLYDLSLSVFVINAVLVCAVNPCRSRDLDVEYFSKERTLVHDIWVEIAKADVILSVRQACYVPDYENSGWKLHLDHLVTHSPTHEWVLDSLGCELVIHSSHCCSF